jgi:hypothetical protein
MSWLKYLQETLGVRSVLCPSAAASPALPSVAVAFIDIQPWSTAETALFEKMRSAMKLSRAQIKIIFTTPGEMTQKNQELSQAGCWVFFSPELATQAPKQGSFAITTFGPRELLQNPQLKKQSWDDLQKVMKKLE